MRRAARLLLLSVVIAGTAWLLVYSIGGPHVPRLPSLGQLKEGLSSSYLPIEALLKALSVVAWLLWFYVVAVTTLRFVAALATRLSLPGASGLTRLSDRVTPLILRRLLDLTLGGALLLSTAGGPHASAATLASARAPAVEVQALDGNGHGDLNDGARPAFALDTYVVRPGDSLWRIADKHLGSGYRWKEIFDLNLGTIQPDGRSLREPRLIRPGWVLQLPSQNGEAPGEESTASPEIAPSLPQPTEPLFSQEVAPSPIQEVDDQGPATDSEAPVVVERPVKIVLPDGLAIPSAFAAGALAASLLGRLRRRRLRMVGDNSPVAPPSVTEQVGVRAGVDPSLDVIGPLSEAVARIWADATGRTPDFVAAFEETGEVTFLIKTGSNELPPVVEGPTGQRIAFDSDRKLARAVVTGPRVTRLRSSPRALSDGGLVPVGLTEAGVVHLPLLGPPMSLAGEAASRLFGSLLTCAAMRLGPESLEVWSVSGSHPVPQGVVSRFLDDEDELVEALQVECLRRRRILAEEGVSGFGDHALEHPDDLLPLVVLVVTEDVFERRRDLLDAVGGFGIVVISMGDANAQRTVDCSESRCEIRVEELEPLLVAAAFVPDDLAEMLSELVAEPAEPVEPEQDLPSALMPQGEPAPDADPPLNDPRTHGTKGLRISEEEAARRIYCLGPVRIQVEKNYRKSP